MAQKIFSVGDVAFELEVHEREVREWAEENDIPAVGTEFMFSEEDVRRFEADIEGDDDDDSDDDEQEPNGDGDDDAEDQ
ncbi:MAG TPA: hypothetical protein VHW01_16580 [Polyangiaceae bacterium]|jgi:hypothetical protein|nr:hypothetical protein [Polyangiaceae bacterium]